LALHLVDIGPTTWHFGLLSGAKACKRNVTVDTPDILLKFSFLCFGKTLSCEQSLKEGRTGWGWGAHDAALLAAESVGNMIVRLIFILNEAF
jgi:hypothetical protein